VIRLDLAGSLNLYSVVGTCRSLLPWNVKPLLKAASAARVAEKQLITARPRRPPTVFGRDDVFP
jgi:hypothetical protein